MTNFKPTKKQVKEKTQQAIEALNEMAKIKIAPSLIHGVGVFALRDIAKGEKLDADAIPHAFDIPFKDFTKLRPEISQLILGQYPLVVTGSHFLYPSTRFLTYVNHSEDANYDAKTDITTRDIAAGEEITEDYRLIDQYEKVFPWISKI